MACVWRADGWLGRGLDPIVRKWFSGDFEQVCLGIKEVYNLLVTREVFSTSGEDR